MKELRPPPGSPVDHDGEAQHQNAEPLFPTVSRGHEADRNKPGTERRDDRPSTRYRLVTVRMHRRFHRVPSKKPYDVRSAPCCPETRALARIFLTAARGGTNSDRGAVRRAAPRRGLAHDHAL